jgi:hypothetical protein
MSMEWSFRPVVEPGVQRVQANVTGGQGPAWARHLVAAVEELRVVPASVSTS